MAALVAPGVCRFAVNGRADNRDIVNIIDMQIDTTGSIDSREEACEAQAGILINEWSDHVLPILVDEYIAVSVSWLDLNSLTGSTGVRTSTDQETWPQAGGSTGNMASSALAAVVDKNTVAVRGQRQGRMYLAPIPEELTAAGLGNVLTPDNLAYINDQMESFLGNINQDGSDVPNYESRMVVVHTVDDVFTSFSVVTSLSARQRLGTQVRRLRG